MKFRLRPGRAPRRKICFVTGARAEYGLLAPLMERVLDDSDFEFQLVVTGSHLSEAHGSTVREIEQDGFPVTERIPILERDDSSAGVTRAMARALEGFAGALSRLRPDMIVLVGDRYEILAAAEAALVARVPIAHLAGGDVTEGAFDEAMRHSITKMAHLHFTTNEAAARRVRQLGEDPRRVFNVGSTGIDRILHLKLLGRAELECKLGIRFLERNLLVTFHPATLDEEPPERQLAELFSAFDSLGPETGIFFTKPNADPEGLRLSRLIDEYVASRPNARAFASLGSRVYLSLMRACGVVAGNSSSGVCEALTFKVPAVNIGDRQKGRVLASSVISCEAKAGAIASAIRTAWSGDYSAVVSPYGDGHASERIVQVLKRVREPRRLLKKRFFETDAAAPRAFNGARKTGTRAPSGRRNLA